MKLDPATLERSQTALLLCRASYDAILIPQGDGWSEPKYFLSETIPDDGGFCIAKDGILWVVSVGTKDRQQWESNAQCRPDQYGIHGGLSRGYAGIQRGLVAAVSSFPSMPIQPTAHSRGGGFAQIYGNSVQCLPPILFESMRWASRQLANKLDRRGVNFVNEFDIVPHLPGKDGPWGYRHTCLTYRYQGPLCEPDSHELDTACGPALTGEFDGPLYLE